MGTAQNLKRLHVTRHKGKLEGTPSVNTSPLDNDYCERMSHMEGTVCGKCYARRLMRFRRTMRALFVTNFDLLQVYPMRCVMPRFDTTLVRFHSFGELGSREHYMNFIDIACASPDTRFALWTKRAPLVEGIDRPPNLSLIYSDLMLDSTETLVPRGFDHRYVVGTTGEPCGSRCDQCALCYQRKVPMVIRQRLH